MITLYATTMHTLKAVRILFFTNVGELQNEILRTNKPQWYAGPTALPGVGLPDRCLLA